MKTSVPERFRYQGPKWALDIVVEQSDSHPQTAIITSTWRNLAGQALSPLLVHLLSDSLSPGEREALNRWISESQNAGLAAVAERAGAPFTALLVQDGNRGHVQRIS